MKKTWSVPYYYSFKEIARITAATVTTDTSTVIMSNDSMSFSAPNV